MPKGKYTLADVDTSQPTAPMGKYTAADVDTSTPPTTAPPQQGFLKSLSDSSGLTSVGSALAHPLNTIQSLSHAGNPFDPQNPIAQVVAGQAQDSANNIKQGVQDFKQTGMSQQTRRDFGRAVPIAGPTLATAQDQHDAGNTAGMLGTLAGPVVAAAGPKLLDSAVSPLLKNTAKAAAIGDTTRMIRPSAADTSFAKAPAEGLLSQPGGTFALSKDSLLAKSKANLNNVGSNISDTIAKAPQTPIDVSQQTVQPFQSALGSAAKNNETGLFGRLQEAKTGLTNDMYYDPSTESIQQQVGPKNLSAVTPSKLFEMKKDIGNSMRWTNQAFDDDLNATKGQIYGGYKDALNTAVPEVRPLNEQYANMRSGINALERRIPIEARNNPISLPEVAATAGTAAASGGPTALTALATKKALFSTPVRTAADTLFYKYGTKPVAPPTAAPSSLFYAPRKRQ